MTTPISIVWWRKIFVRYGRGISVLMMIALVVGFGWNQFGSHPDNGTQTNPDKVIMTVNGIPVTQQQYMNAEARVHDTAPGPEFAQAQASVIEQLVQGAVLAQLAKQHGVKVESADVDRQIDQIRDQANLKNASDTDLDNWIQQRLGIGLAEYREQLASSPQMLFNGLLLSYKADQHVTDQDVKNQNSQVKLDVMLISYGVSRFGPPPKGTPLTEPQAKAKAEALLAQIRSGADFAALARANSGDFSAKNGGVTEDRPEYENNGQSNPMGALGFGKDFDAAVQKTAVGQITDVFKAGGFQQGYVFAKVIDRKVNTPKDFDPRKALDQLKTQRAEQKLQADVMAGAKAATVKITDPDKKSYYDYGQLMQLQQPDIQAIMSGQMQNPAKQTDIARLQTLVDTEFEAQLKRHPDDATIAMLVAQDISTRKMFAPGTTAQQRSAYQDQLISIYQQVLKTTEDRNIRFELADLYKEKKDFPKADEQYSRVSRYMSEDPPYDLNSYQTYKGFYDRLTADFTQIDEPQKADEMRRKSADLQGKIVIEQAKQAAANRAPAGGAGTPIAPGGTVVVPPRGTHTPPAGGAGTPIAPGGTVVVPPRGTHTPPARTGAAPGR